MTKKGNPVIAWPTGTGKSLVPAEFIRRTMYHYPDQRFLMLTHVSKLIEQNHQKMLELWTQAPIGIYSAELNSRDIMQPIIYGGIQSMIKIAEAFGYRDIIFIDEAHLVSMNESSMYQRFIAILKRINPRLKIIGMSATPYRIGQGMITDDGLFTDIAHDLTSLENFNQLVYDGYISPLVPKKTQVELDVSNVGIQKGEFITSQLQHQVDTAEITWKAMQELCYYGQNRRSWLIYATGIEHSDHIAEMLGKLGIECASVHSKQSKEYNRQALEAHKNLKLKAIVSYSKLTTGLDHPAVDLIGCLRPTLSVALWVQMLGRGTRPVFAPGFDLQGFNTRWEAIRHGGKQNCLVLDFARNTTRLGPINDPVIPKKKGDKEGTIPIKLCEGCGTYHHIKAVYCDQCGKPFEFKVKIVEKAGTDELIANYEAPKIEFYDINYITYNKHSKANKPPSLKVTYFSANLDGFSEYICLEHKGLALHNAHNWWRQRTTIEPPTSIEDALKLTSKLRHPKRIRVHLNRKINGRKYPEILSHEFGE